MSEIVQPNSAQHPQKNALRQSRMTLKKGKYIGPYEILDLLREGSSSKIYLAKSLYNNENVVIKAISKTSLQKNLDDILLITKQIETLKILKHRNIITLYEIYESNKYIFLITEYCSGKNLIEKIIQKKRFSEEEALIIFFQLLDAFTYMHKMNICHRNIRAEHILFDKNNRPKIVGFGYSSFYEKNKKIKGAYGSLCYACPEIIDEQPYNPELADVWSLGVILYVLICGYLPFSDEDDDRNKMLISEGKIEFPKEISNKLKDLLRHMLDKNQEKRYNFQKIVKHPWIKPYNETFFSQGINIHKTIYPVDEKILNIILEYNFDKNKIKEDLINNKYNTGTGLYKQIVRKLMDLKIKNISDLFCEEFNAYRDNIKNKYENGDERYEKYIQNVVEKYNKKENFVNKFRQREDEIVDKLLALKEQKNEKKNELNVINEEENDNINTEDKLKINDNVEIIYNNEQEEDVDIIQKFKEEQSKKKIIIDESEHNKFQSSPNITNFYSNNENDNVEIDDNNATSFRLSSIPELSEKNSLSKKILDNQNNLSTEEKDVINLNKENNIQNQVDKNHYKSIVNTNIFKSNINKQNDTSFTNNSFRMTAIRKTNAKTYFERGSLYDDFLKKNHPENVRKTLLKSKFATIRPNLNKQNKIDDIKEKEEIESDKEEKKEKENDKKLDQLKYSFSFDDDEEEENKEDDDDDNIDVIDGDGDEKLFNMFNNDDNEEIKELKKLYYGDNLKESINFLKKSIVRKKTVKFLDSSQRKEKETETETEKKKKEIEIKRVGTNVSELDMDKYEEKLKEYNKIFDISNTKEEKNKLEPKIEISFHDDNNEKNNFVYFNVDKNNSKKLDFNINKDSYNINDINNLLKKNSITKYNEALPSEKIKVIEDNNFIDPINELFLKKYKGKLNKNKKVYKKNGTEFFLSMTNQVQNKIDESTQTTLSNNYKSNKFKIIRSFFTIRSNINKYKSNTENDNYPYFYNGNNQINIDKINNNNNPMSLKYNKSQILHLKKKELDKPKISLKYLNNNIRNNSPIDYNNIKTNNSYAFNKSPVFRNKYSKNNAFLESIDYNAMTSDRQRTFIRNKNDKFYIKKRNIKEDMDNCNNFSMTIPREKSATNTVKNIKKEEVIVKRNEIIEKIQHCQNLLNTIMVDKKYSLANMINLRNNNKNNDDMKNNLYTFNKKIPQVSEFDTNKSYKINNNGINHIFKKNSLNISVNNPHNLNNKYTYKKINIKYLDKATNDIYSFDNISRDNTYNSVTPQENYCFTDNNNFYSKPLKQKGVKKYKEESRNLNNYSFDAPHKRKNNLTIKTGYNFPMYINNKNKINDNSVFSKTVNNEDNDNDIFSKNIYKTKNINVNNNPFFQRLKGYKDLNYN